MVTTARTTWPKPLEHWGEVQQGPDERVNTDATRLGETPWG